VKISETRLQKLLFLAVFTHRLWLSFYCGDLSGNYKDLNQHYKSFIEEFFIHYMVVG
jgi:hypothetical protein